MTPCNRKAVCIFLKKIVLDIKALWEDSKIMHKLLMSFLFLSIIPLLLICIFTYQSSSSDIREKIQTYSVQVMDQAGRNIQTQIDSVEGFCDELMLHEDVQKGLSSHSSMDDVQKRNISVSINEFLDKRYLMLKNITNISILTKDKEAIYSYGYSILNIDDINLESEDNRLPGQKSQWSYKRLKDRNNVAVVRVIKDVAYTGTTLGYLVITLEEKCFLDIYKDINIGKGANIFIADAKGLIISSGSGAIKPGTQYSDDTLIENIKNSNERNQAFSIIHENERYLVTFSYIDNSNWYMISTIPYSYLNNQSKNTGIKIAFIGLICLIGAIQLSYLIATSISSPLNEMVKLMKTAERGNLAVRLHYEAKNEVGYLANSFNRMLKQISKLIRLVEEEQKKKRETEIRMLQAQINPHFLFNTLNSLKWTAKMSQADSVSEGLEALAGLLKSSIVDTKEYVSFDEEIRNIENYIIIQRIRYGTLFEVEYHLDHSLSKCKILKFLMQPIIENSILHGIEDMDSGARITISGTCFDGKIQVVISDNGKGMPESKIKELAAGLGSSEKKFSSIGIRNVMERIKLNFGEDYGLQIDSRLGQGTRVILTLPYISEDEVGGHV